MLSLRKSLPQRLNTAIPMLEIIPRINSTSQTTPGIGSFDLCQTPENLISFPALKESILTADCVDKHITVQTIVFNETFIWWRKQNLYQ